MKISISSEKFPMSMSEIFCLVMIKINKLYSAVFIESYLEFALDKVVLPRISEMLTKVPAAQRGEVRNAFTKVELIRMLTERPEVLENIAVGLFDKFPAIAERYCYSFLLERITLPEQARYLDLSSSVERAEFDRAIEETIDALETLTSEHSLHLTPHYLKLLGSSETRSKKRRYLCRLINAQKGKSPVTEADREIFPKWINDLVRCFDYEVVAGEFAQKIIDQLAVTVCPYCGIESVQSIPKINVRPELDHFFPKSRFPFLAISLYNLMPAGWICNQRHKRNNSMLGRLNPYSIGFEHGTVFKFGFLPGGDIRDNMSIEILPQACDLKDGHVKMFKLEALYDGTEDLREWLADKYEAHAWLKEVGRLGEVDFGTHPYRSYIDLRRPVTKVRAQKFMVDALNDLFNQSLEVVPAPIA
ncbi:hypothetical protein N8H71_00555 [Pseudomonas koreensis]|uniref:hypothetical protein n=1 Tax=Pseudomonas koreensis TaxID=198620 RepID=UPI0021C57470|nr:hypothetical protein [Pseudomonas koreensis]MCU0070056.1 hypothetical protein [Pseudomonas koreensis]